MIDRKLILSKTDHTLLRQDATVTEILQLCEDAARFHTASVCIPPRFVAPAAAFLAGRVAVCTVVGFPLGYQTLSAKAKETEEALKDGATEIDMVISVGDVKTQNFAAVKDEISTLKSICGENCLKVIIEACLLTDDEKRTLTELVAAGGADFIKTSTGFSRGGATLEDVRLFKETVPELKVKAAGGIRTFEFANELLLTGADRLGASALVELCK